MHVYIGDLSVAGQQDGGVLHVPGVRGHGGRVLPLLRGHQEREDTRGDTQCCHGIADTTFSSPIGFLFIVCNMCGVSYSWCVEYLPPAAEPVRGGAPAEDQIPLLANCLHHLHRHPRSGLPLLPVLLLPPAPQTHRRRRQRWGGRRLRLAGWG